MQSSMRHFRSVSEAPIASWVVDQDFDRNEAEMVSKFTGYAQEKLHWSAADKRAIQDTSSIARVSKAFDKCPVPFNLYFWQSDEPDYDITLQKGLVSPEGLTALIGERSAYEVLARRADNAISVVMTNNLSDVSHITLRSPWMVAHRLSHVILAGRDTTNEAANARLAFDEFTRSVLSTGYGLEWPDEEYEFGRIIAQEYRDVYSKMMGHFVGTMKSAREGQLVNRGEWVHETFAQFIITGKVTLRPLPEVFDEDMELTSDLRLRNKTKMLWLRFPQRLERMFKKAMGSARGQIFVM